VKIKRLMQVPDILYKGGVYRAFGAWISAHYVIGCGAITGGEQDPVVVLRKYLRCGMSREKSCVILISNKYGATT
jgi:hypothetical protein